MEPGSQALVMMVLEAGGDYSRHTHRNRQGSRKETKLTPGDDLSWWSWVLWKEKKKKKKQERRKGEDGI